MQNVTKGEAILSVDDTSKFTPGLWVRLLMDNPATGGLVTDLMSGRVQEDAVMYRGKTRLLSFHSRVSVVGAGWVKLERALPYNVSTRYNPVFHRFDGECWSK
jgi:hypothetical protein